MTQAEELTSLILKSCDVLASKSDNARADLNRIISHCENLMADLPCEATVVPVQVTEAFDGARLAFNGLQD